MVPHPGHGHGAAGRGVGGVAETSPIWILPMADTRGQGELAMGVTPQPPGHTHRLTEDPALSSVEAFVYTLANLVVPSGREFTDSSISMH